jgi:hypothetical protein
VFSIGEVIGFSLSFLTATTTTTMARKLPGDKEAMGRVSFVPSRERKPSSEFIGRASALFPQFVRSSVVGRLDF